MASCWRTCSVPFVWASFSADSATSFSAGWPSSPNSTSGTVYLWGFEQKPCCLALNLLFSFLAKLVKASNAEALGPFVATSLWVCREAAAFAYVC